MGGRLSVPQGPGLTESNKALPKKRFPVNARTIVGPIGIVVLAGIFFVYSRTSIQAAKENAKRHREADGGSISWRNESLRRHGALKKPEERSLWQQLTAKDDGEEKSVDSKKRQLDAPAQRREYNPIEEGIRRARAKSYNTPDDT